MGERGRGCDFKGEAVVVVESDKADMDVESFYDGFLAHICVEDGEMATVGAPIAYVAETGGGEIPEAEAKAAAASGGGRTSASACGGTCCGSSGGTGSGS